MGGAGVIALLAAAKWLSGRHTRRHTKTVAARVERKLLAEGELGSTTAPRSQPADMLKTALRPHRANQVADSNRSSRSGGSPHSQHSQHSSSSPTGFRTDGRIAPVISPVPSPRPDASPAATKPNNPTSPTGPTSPAGPANPPRPAHLLDRDVSRGAGGLAPDARLQARSSIVSEYVGSE